MAQRGVALLQEAHSLSTAQAKSLVPILTRLVEAGIVESAAMGGRTWSADTALLIDANRRSQAVLGSTSGESPILCQIPLLSRLDAIFAIETSGDAAWELAQQIVKEAPCTPSSDDLRDLKLLVAAVHERGGEVDLSRVASGMAKSLGRLADELKTIDQGADYAVRLAVSLRRLVRASARSSVRRHATSVDVSRAERMLRHKVRFLVAHLVRMTGRPAVVDWLRADWVGVVVTTALLQREYSRAFNFDYTPKTFRRALESVGARAVGHGKWVVDGRPAVDEAVPLT
jgi:hypothetical protein